MPTSVFDMGDTVLCDSCDGLFTAESPDIGGILFQSKALCPACAPEWEAGAIKYGEADRCIRDRARPGETFHAATMRWRNGNNAVVVTGSQEFVDSMVTGYVKRTGRT